MANRMLQAAVAHLRQVLCRPHTAGVTDAEVLERFLQHRDEAALAALVRRHGPMVWGVCSRVLPNYHDAEDAFQATFLVLVRKAASIALRELLANWLYGVAHQTALKSRARRPQSCRAAPGRPVISDARPGGSESFPCPRS